MTHLKDCMSLQFLKSELWWRQPVRLPCIQITFSIKFWVIEINDKEKDEEAQRI